MKWANFLHFYQPATQQPDILESIVVESYRPIFQGLLRHRRARITVNVTGTLLEQFDSRGYRDLIDILRKLGDEGRVEFTGTAKYHAFLPFLEDADIIRQIKKHNETSVFFLGSAYRPTGFFPPEMGYEERLAPLIAEMGFKWILLDEIALNGSVGAVDYTTSYKIKNTGLRVYFRERRTSNLIMSAVVRSAESLASALGDDMKSGRYLVTAMDGETFGHHRPGLEKLLFEIFDSSDFDFVTISELAASYPNSLSVSPVASTWASSPEDIARGAQFLSWRDPENQIHLWQEELVSLSLRLFRSVSFDHPRYRELERRMDEGLASDHFWWASAKPWWSTEMIEAGAYHLLELVRALPNAGEKEKAQASALYEKIISTAFQWQRSGKVRKMIKEQKARLRIPFKERTLEKGGAERGVYYAFLSMMERLEREARDKREYEAAILWRDAAYKLEHKFDIYDAVNAIDLLRVHIPHEEVERTIEKYKEKYREIRGGQPEQRG